MVHVDHDFSMRRKIENQRISSSPVTDAVDGPLARNKGTESVKSRHVVIRYGLLALKRVDLLRVQSSIKYRRAVVVDKLFLQRCPRIKWHAAATRKNGEGWWMRPQRKFNLVDPAKKFLTAQLVPSV